MQRVSAADLSRLTADATVLEQDGLGPKVLRLQDGSFLKLFRKRRYFSSETLKPYAKRFADNATTLQRLGFTCPQIIGVYRVEDPVNGTAVHYLPLPGDTLRSRLEHAAPARAAQLIGKFGHLLARLHRKGVYFRSIHLGNVLVLPSDELALIDIADMHIGRFPLSLHKRLRNLKHMRRYPQDSNWLFERYQEDLLKAYRAEEPRHAEALLARTQRP